MISSFPSYVMSSVLFWNITQRRVVTPYRRFGTTYLSHLQGSRRLLVLLHPWKWDRFCRNIGTALTLRCIIFQKNADTKKKNQLSVLGANYKKIQQVIVILWSLQILLGTAIVMTCPRRKKKLAKPLLVAKHVSSTECSPCCFRWHTCLEWAE